MWKFVEAEKGGIEQSLRSFPGFPSVLSRFSEDLGRRALMESSPSKPNRRVFRFRIEPPVPAAFAAPVGRVPV